jgi:hypothetical protein
MKTATFPDFCSALVEKTQTKSNSSATHTAKAARWFSQTSLFFRFLRAIGTKGRE